MTKATMSHEAFNELVIDYLDGQLGEDVRQAFEQTMQAQPDWAEDVRALERTWRQARQTLKADERPAPSRVRTHVLAEASKRAALLREQQAIHNTATVAAHKHVGIVERVRKSWLGRPWFAPVFIAAAAVGVYVINQKSFETTRARSVGHSLEEAQETRPLPATSPASPEATAELPPADELSDVLAPATKGDERFAEPQARNKPARLEPKVSPKPEPNKDKRRRNAGIASEREATIGELLGDQGYAQPPAGWGRGEGAAPTQAAKTSKKARTDVEESRSYGSAEKAASADDAAPGHAPSASAPAGGSVPARAPTASASAGDSAPSRPPAPAPAAVSGAGAAPRRAERAPLEAAQDAEADAVSEGARRDSAWAGLSRADLLARAQRAEASGQWRMVIDLYKELLRRHPKDEQAPAWRRGLERAQQALD